MSDVLLGVGVALLIVAAFLVAIPAGVAAVGLALVGLSYLVVPAPPQE